MGLHRGYSQDAMILRRPGRDVNSCLAYKSSFLRHLKDGGVAEATPSRDKQRY